MGRPVTDQNTPKVSVVIPTHNRYEDLKRALDSVARQDYPCLEIVVVDDASTEDISSAFQPLAQRKDIALIFLRNEVSIGAQPARILGCQAATSDIVALLDSDDWWMPNKISSQVQVFRQHTNALLSCRSILTSNNVTLPKRLMRSGEKAEEYLYATSGGFFQSSTFMMAKDLMIDCLKACRDYGVHDDTWLAIHAQRAGLPLIQLDQQLAVYNDRPRGDRISYDRRKLLASLQWFDCYTSDWSRKAKSGYMLVDLVPRALHLGNRWEALSFLIKGLNLALPLDLMIRTAANVLFNGSPLRFFRRTLELPLES